MIENAQGAKTCAWQVEGTDDDPGEFEGGGDISLRRV
jgi:hypothetical protein